MKTITYFLVFATLISCNGIKSIKNALKDTPRHQKYLQSLETAGLQNTDLYQQWKTASESVFDDSLLVDLPFEETGYFDEGKPTARGYKFKVKEGQVLSFKCDAKVIDKDQLFIELFKKEGENWAHQTSRDSTFTIQHEFDEDGIYMIRLQPALLVNAYFRILITLGNSLQNPVLGANNSAIQSFYGNPRDGGERSHEGIDIFAKRGTPVVAPTSGYVARVGNNNLGGKVIWLRDKKRSQSYYFAHLDSQIVQTGTYVKLGDTLGLVGNSGNAISTAPHLHFGIYQSGSKDPLNYVYQWPEFESKTSIDSVILNQQSKITAQIANLRAGPSTQKRVKSQLTKNTYVKVIGQTNDWLLIETAENKKGYVFNRLVSTIYLNTTNDIVQTQKLFSKPSITSVPITQLPDNSKITVLASHENFIYVATADYQNGWLEKVVK